MHPAEPSDFHERGDEFSVTAANEIDDMPSAPTKCAMCGATLAEPDVRACPECGEALVSNREPDGPTGLGGWLILPAIGLTVTVVTNISQLKEHLELLADPLFGNEVPGLKRLIGAYCIMETITGLWAGVNLLLYFLRNHRFPKSMIAYLVANLVMVTLLLVMGWMTFAGWNEVTSAMGFDVFRAVLIAIVWISYFRVSKRVKNTFVK